MATETVTAKAARLEKELASFKAKVVSEVQRFRDSGDLCDDEYINVRSNLGLEDLLPGKGWFKIEWNPGDLTFEVFSAAANQLTLDHDDIVEAVAGHFTELIEKGIKVKGRKYTRDGYKNWEANVKFDGDLDTYSWEEE